MPFRIESRRRRGRWAVALLLVALLPGVAAAQVPHLTGEVTTDPPRGLISGDLCLSGLPAGDTLRFLLHNGLNIRAVHDSTGRLLPYRGYFGGRMIGEGLLYTVVDTLPGRRTLCVSYTGAFPVYPALDNSYDFKGVIAFSGRTVRASEQAKWYPVLYDSASGHTSEAVTYGLRVSCPTCTALYVGGSPPALGTRHDFSSTIPRFLLLFAGDFQAREMAGTWFLNSAVPDSGKRQIGRAVGEIQRFYERVLDVPFADTLVMIESDALNEAPTGRVWGFTSWPAIVFAGAPFSTIAAGLTTPDTTNDWMLPFVAHELAHYYFGTRIRGEGALQGFFVESTAGYLSLRAIRQLQGDSAYHAAVRAHAHDALMLPRWTALDSVTDEGVSDAYRYRYGPLVLVAFEREFGIARTGRMLHDLLMTPPATAFDYGRLARAAVAAGVTPAEWALFERRCIRASLAASCVAAMGTGG